MDLHEVLELKNWAVVGSTHDTSKWAYKVFHKLNSRGYNVYPVNSKQDEVDGVKCYHSLRDVEVPIDVVSLIINPKAGMEVVEEAKEKGIKNIWCQPGAESQELIEKAKAYGINIIHNECVLVELG